MKYLHKAKQSLHGTRSKLNRDFPNYFFFDFLTVFCGIFGVFPKKYVNLQKYAEIKKYMPIF